MTFEGGLIPEILSPQSELLPDVVNATILQDLSTTPKMANIPTPIPQSELNDGTSIPMLAYGSKSFTHLLHLPIVLTVPSRDCLV